MVGGEAYFIMLTASGRVYYVGKGRAIAEGYYLVYFCFSLIFLYSYACI